MSYKARKFATFKDLEEATRVVQEEFQGVEQYIELQDVVMLQILHAAPEKLVEGMIVYADGVDWNPGAGEGVYRRDKTNASWVFVG